jgi:CRISPR-associated protein Csm5
MAYISIETLTPVHVGSGKIFKNTLDCLDFPQETVWAILDENKAMKLIGEKQLNQWVSCIENGKSVLDLIKTRKPKLIASDVAQRVLEKANSSHDAMDTHEIREQIHTHNSIPYLPGSSIKGSMRTALFNSELLKKGSVLQQEITNFKGKFSDKNISQKMMGKDPNHDPLRFLQITDVHFHKTKAWVTGSYNNNHWEKKRFKQWTEAIDAKQIAFGKLTVGGVRFDALKYNKNAEFKFKNLEDLSSEKSLFSCINAYSLQQIQNEINWAESKGNFQDSASTENYIDNLYILKNKIEALAETECILRMGYGTGLNNMTGGWQQKIMSKELYSNWKLKTIKSSNYIDLDFPKTRRMLEGGIPLGYIKISVLQEGKIQDLSLSERLKGMHTEGLETEMATSLEPEYVSGPFRKGTEIPAQCIGPGKTSPNHVLMKLLITPSDNEIAMEVRYPAGLEPLSYHLVRINEIKKDNRTILSIEYAKAW